MSVHDGKKAANSILEFNKATGVFGDKNNPLPVELLAKTLQTRELGEKHFAQAYDYFKSMRASAVIKIADELHYNPTSTLQDRQLSTFLFYMAIAKAENGQLSYDEYVPHIISSKIRSNLLSFTARPMPLIFSSQHTEFRFIQRSGERLDYSSEDSQWAMVTGLMMALTLPRSMVASRQQTTPVAIPYADGMYLGHAVFCDETAYYPEGFLLSIHGRNGDASTLHGLKDGKRIITEPDWSPQSYIRIHTYVSERELHRDQKQLYEVFVELFRASRTERTYNTLINSYINLMPNDQDQTSDISWLAAKFRAIYDSPDWKSVNKFGQKHLPSRDLN